MNFLRASLIRCRVASKVLSELQFYRSSISNSSDTTLPECEECDYMAHVMQMRPFCLHS
jgi:hypothetical protein